MPLHLLVASGNQAQSAAFTQVPFLQTSYENVQNNNFVVGALNLVVAAYGFGTTLDRLQLREPVLTQGTPGYPDLVPINNAVPTDAIEPSVVDLFDNPIQLKTSEQLSVYVVQLLAGAELEYVALWMADQVPAPVKGKIITQRATGASTLTAGAWTLGVPLTFENNLPAGKYTCVGFRAQSATGLFCRFGTQGNAYRAGGIMARTSKARLWPKQRMGMMGPLFTFDNTVQVTGDFFATAADTSEIVEFDLIPS